MPMSLPAEDTMGICERSWKEKENLKDGIDWSGVGELGERLYQGSTIVSKQPMQIDK
jgi:hypothetical protein